LKNYIVKFLEENHTPVATGDINEGIDLIAIRNLARDHDIAVPIARGGLYQGAIAKLWGMKTRTVDVAAHKRKVARGKWVDQVLPEDFNDKRILLFDKDAVTGATTRKTISMLSRYKPKSISAYFTHPGMHRGEIKIGTILESLPPDLEVFDLNNTSLEEGGDAYIEAHERLETLYGRRRLIERSYNNDLIPDLQKRLNSSGGFLSYSKQVSQPKPFSSLFFFSANSNCQGYGHANKYSPDNSFKSTITNQNVDCLAIVPFPSFPIGCYRINNKKYYEAKNSSYD
jgi:hypothetical protein